jgi:hypothetical protein
MAEIKEPTESGTVKHTISPASQGIDIDQLAEKVYQLLCREVRQDRARGTTRRQRN